MSDNTPVQAEDLHAQWEEIGRRNVEQYNKNLAREKTFAIVILVVIVAVNFACIIINIMNNFMPLVLALVAFSLIIIPIHVTKNFIPTMKKEPKVYNPADNPI